MPNLVRLLFALLVCLAPLGSAPAAAAQTTYKTWTARWLAAEGQFAGWQRDGTVLDRDGVLKLDGQRARAGTDPYTAGSYAGGDFYNGGTFFVGEAISPAAEPGIAFTQAIPSWNATTPAGTWIETQMRVRIGTRWTRWYNLGVWASDDAAVQRHSVKGERDADASVDTDTLVMAGARTASAVQLKIRLFAESRSITPGLRLATVAVSTTPSRPATLAPGQRARWDRKLALPQCSQMVYRDGGEVWCSPTSTSMVLAYWERATGPCEPRVRKAVSGVYDRIYRGHGNWPFNAAYAATQGMEAYVARFSSLAQVEEWIAAGVPVVVSYSWGRGQLTGAPLASSSGHLAVISGFDARGNPVVHDPAAPRDAAVQRVYQRAQLERLWLQRSGGTAYLIYPVGWKVPTQ